MFLKSFSGGPVGLRAGLVLQALADPFVIATGRFGARIGKKEWCQELFPIQAAVCPRIDPLVIGRKKSTLLATQRSSSWPAPLKIQGERPVVQHTAFAVWKQLVAPIKPVRHF